jgi:D-alanine-D-alanine ligase and related ATP-grasp enzymes
MTEINVSVIGGRPPKASVIEVPIKESGFLSYEDKYLKGGQKFSSQGMASLSRLIDPQDISKELKQKVIQIALEAYRLIGAQGVVRFDFIYDKKSHKLFFNELNAIPGSFSYYLWEKSTPPIFYPDLIESMVKQAEKRHADRSSLKTEFGFHALK